MTSADVRMKLLCCMCVYALIALSPATNGQDNGTDYSAIKAEPQDKNTTEYESTSGQSFTPDPFNVDGGFVNGTNVTTTAVYDKALNASTDYGDFVKAANESTDYDGNQNGTGVGESEEENGGNLTTKTHGPTMPLPAGPESKTSNWWGYVILILILLLILALCIILFYMRRVTRTYSFDLQRPAPVRTNEPIGTFEPVYLDDLDYQIHSVGNATSVDEANGTVLSSEDKEEPSRGEAENDEPQTNGLQTPVPPETSPTAQTEPDQDQETHTDQLDQDLSPSPILFIEESDEETNGNNNNSPTVRSGDPFVEINLEEPQQTPMSSVQPFSPSIFSSLS